jgi:hypothetical protein
MMMMMMMTMTMVLVTTVAVWRVLLQVGHQAPARALP